MFRDKYKIQNGKEKAYAHARTHVRTHAQTENQNTDVFQRTITGRNGSVPLLAFRTAQLWRGHVLRGRMELTLGVAQCGVAGPLRYISAGGRTPQLLSTRTFSNSTQNRKRQLFPQQRVKVNCEIDKILYICFSSPSRAREILDIFQVCLCEFIN